MRTKLNLIYIIIFSTIISSCGVLKTNTSKVLDIYGAGVIQNPVLVDLDVKETKVSGTASGSSSNIEDIKHDAVANAIEKSNIDVLVEPKFITESVNGKTTVTVTGFPASYKNFRSITQNDLKLLEAGITQKAKVYESQTTHKATKQQTGNKTGIILGTIGVVGMLVVFAFLL